MSRANPLSVFQCAPILLIGFNRPDFLRDQIETLSQIEPSVVFVAVDGPRGDHPGEESKCAETAKQIENISWPCKIHTRIRKENLGCKYGPPDAISWFFSEVEAGIILEDDCRPTPDFLRFASELLVRHKDDERIGMISGNNHYGFMSHPHDSYRFSMNISIWGWASWRRAWELFDGEPEHFRPNAQKIFDSISLTNRGKHLGMTFFAQVLDNQNTWDTQWALSLLSRGMLSVTPAVNLVANSGFEADGTHTCGYQYDIPHFISTGRLTFPLTHPVAVSRDKAADRKHEFRSFAFLPRVLTVIGRRFPKGSKTLLSLAYRLEKKVPILFRL